MLKIAIAQRNYTVGDFAAKEPCRNNCHIWIDSGGRAAALLVVAIARYDSSSRLASHPARTTQTDHLFLYASLDTCHEFREYRLCGFALSFYNTR